VLDKISKAIGVRLEHLLGNGISKSRISLAHYPDGRTEIVVDGIPDSEFFLNYRTE
jgi:hypothetical protein